MIRAALCLALFACAEPPAHRRAAGPSVIGDSGTPSLDAGQADASDASPSAALYYVYQSLDACAAVAVVVDQAQGYPRRGVDMGGGVHVGPDGGWTITYASCLPLEASTSYAYPSDGVTASTVAKVSDASATSDVAIAASAVTP
jgi:hypothetical protein